MIWILISYVEAIDISQLALDSLYQKKSLVVKNYEYIDFLYLSCSYCACQEIHIAL